jgi:hypothetical protein
MQKARTAIAAAAGECFPTLVPQLASPTLARTPLGSPPSSRSYLSVRTISKIRIKKTSANGLYTYGGCNTTYVDTVWTLYEYVTVNFCYFQIAVKG